MMGGFVVGTRRELCDTGSARTRGRGVVLEDAICSGLAAVVDDLDRLARGGL